MEKLKTPFPSASRKIVAPQLPGKTNEKQIFRSFPEPVQLHSETVIVSLDAIANSADENEIERLRTNLTAQGWSLVHLPAALRPQLQAFCAVSKDFFENEQQDAKEKYQIPPSFGYAQNAQKQSLTYLTGGMVDDSSRAELIPDFKNLQQVYCDFMHALDAVLRRVLDRAGEKIYGAGFEGARSEIPLLRASGLDSGSPNRKNFGMIDAVRYNNRDPHNVLVHVDPGLLSLSYFSDAQGLEMLDREGRWVQVPWNDLEVGILWNGLKAQQITDGRMPGGKHRVRYHGQAPRFTSWYEICDVQQVSELLDSSGSQLAIRRLYELEAAQQKPPENNKKTITVNVVTQNSQ